MTAGIPDVPITCQRCHHAVPCSTSLVDVEREEDVPTMLLRVNLAALIAHQRLQCGRPA